MLDRDPQLNTDIASSELTGAMVKANFKGAPVLRPAEPLW